VNEEGKVGHHIWTEYICTKETNELSQVCRECSIKNPGHREQSSQKMDHGLIGGPYTKESKLYGSPYYLKDIKSGWKILEADEIRAKAAVDKALSEMAGRKKKVENEVVQVEQPGQAEPGQVEPGQAVGQEQPVQAQQPTVDVKPKVKKPRAKKEKDHSTPGVRGRPRKVKLKQDVDLPVIEPVPECDKEPKFIESILAPVVITDCVVIKVKKIKCQGKDYYHDSNSGKMYAATGNRVGAYKGRYNAEEDVVNTAFPDSDCEEV
jgi:ribosomal protein L20A (L18A)